MRVQCEQCGAAYSVADDKIAGRKLKQKCRKCGAQMVIDGTAVAQHAHDETPMAMPAAPSAEPEEAAWHIAVGDTTQGPYTLQELAQYYADGSVVLDTLVCRDGWNDWKPAGEVQEVLNAVHGPALVSVLPPAFASAPPAPPAPPALGQAVTMGRDPFADSSSDSGPRVSADELQARGAQHDGTVQFSMDAIRALSSVSSPSVPPPAPMMIAGHATGDDSGLIDMRALAEAEAKAAAEAAQAALSPATNNGAFRSIRTSEIGSVHGLSPLTLGGRDGGIDFRTKVMASVAAFALVVAAAVAIVVVLRSSQPVAAEAPLAAAATVATTPPVPSAAPALPSAALAAAVAPTRAATTAGVAASQDEGDDDDGSSKRGHHGARRSRRGGDGGKASARDQDSVDDVLAKAEPPKKSSSAGASIDDLLEGAINGKRSAPKEEASEPASSLPKTPSKDQMLPALGRAKAKAAACKGKGVATAAITITGKSGKATSVNVSGVDGAAKACVEKAVRSTPFPRFQNDTMKVQFPFKLGA